VLTKKRQEEGGKDPLVNGNVDLSERNEKRIRSQGDIRSNVVIGRRASFGSQVLTKEWRKLFASTPLGGEGRGSDNDWLKTEGGRKKGHSLAQELPKSKGKDSCLGKMFCERATRSTCLLGRVISLRMKMLVLGGGGGHKRR